MNDLNRSFAFQHLSAETITPGYVEQNKLLHERSAEYGTSGQKWGRYIERLIKEEKYSTVLDYGCGKGTLQKVLAPFDIDEYDPAIPGKDARPEPAELVVCTDVLEHIEPELLQNVLADLKALTKTKLFFNVATRPAIKKLPDGRNAHLIQQPAKWWFAELSKHFTITLWQEREGLVYGEAVPGGGLITIKDTYQRRNRQERRRIEHEMAPIVKLVRETTAKYGDQLSRVKTADQWEPWDDTAADMLVCGLVLEKLDSMPGPAGSELERAMTVLCLQARLCVCVVIALDAARGEKWWRAFLERYLIISDWVIRPGAVPHLFCIGGPATKVQGVKTVMGTKDVELWTQIKANIARVKKRIEPKPEHGRRAILACYGPSLGEYLFKIAEERATEESDVISVSGSHDFLLAHSITPDMHVECDARPHKADNIAVGIAGVHYLIASMVHGRVFDKLEGCDVSLWHTSMQDFMVPLVDELGEKGDHIISGGGSVGLRAIPLLYTLGYRKYSVYAMDCSFADDGNKQWAGKHAGKKQDVVTCRCGDRMFYTSPVLMTYAANFMDTMRKMEGCVFRVYGDGLLSAMCRLDAGEAP